MKQLVNSRENHYLAVLLSENNDEQVLEKLADTLYGQDYVTEQYKGAIKRREKEFPTGLPTGEICVAIPHTDPQYVNAPAICLGILEKPVEFHVMGMENETVDVQIVFMLAIKKKEDQLGLLQKLIEVCQNQEILKVIMQGNEEIINKVMMELIK